MIIVKQIKLPVTHSMEQLYKKAEQILGKQFHRKVQVSEMDIRRQSLDARKRKPENAMIYVYEIAVQLMQVSEKEEQKLVEKFGKNTSDILFEPASGGYSFEQEAFWLSEHTVSDRPVVIGLGPAGIFAAYLLAQAGLRPIIIERGDKMEDRVRVVDQFWAGSTDEHGNKRPTEVNPEANVQFGEGGAGTFSDGKLNTLIKNSKDYQHYVLETFVRHGANKDIIYSSKPHIGTDVLRDVVMSMRYYILSKGGEIRYRTRLDDIVIRDGSMQSILLSDKTKIVCKDCILAVGHSARDTFSMLKKNGIVMEKKPFAVGVRVMHDQHMIDNNQYGMDYPDCLPPANYKLTAHTQNNRSVYSFCMCPGGYVVNASSEKNALAINGMSYRARDSKCANSAIVVAVEPSDFDDEDVLAGVRFQQDLEQKAFRLKNGAIPVQTMQEFLKTSTNAPDIEPKIKGIWAQADLALCLPPFIYEALQDAMFQYDRKIPGFAGPDAWVCAIESRTSSPVRIVRDDTLQSILPAGVGHIEGLYPCGEGAGYAGGITSAAIDGLRCAQAIIKKYSDQLLELEKQT